ncbi:hypothetical protein INH39_30795 [Massilia violaceinigra]|uniref:Uncharacterized protein n=1 Tax=Massilia violaceinigra TaxID=2045208 RepID=A0ABY4A4K2_9BURK|nr:hypothetical protein [Massilia violaceinigra]UOD29721.1 hypothetical protein INH39_30795 [Massilia violaceinigra]
MIQQSVDGKIDMLAQQQLDQTDQFGPGPGMVAVCEFFLDNSSASGSGLEISPMLVSIILRRACITALLSPPKLRTSTTIFGIQALSDPVALRARGKNRNQKTVHGIH